MLARRMTGLHAILGIAALATNAVAAVWGAVAWIRQIASVRFWYALRVAQVVVVAAVVDGVVLLVDGRKPPDQLHYVYAVAPLVIAMVTEGMRTNAAAAELASLDADPETLPRREQVLLARRIVIREIGIMTVGVILVVTLLLRAAQSGGAF
jgi:hypothetical protein